MNHISTGVWAAALCSVLLLSGCSSAPQNITPVENFDAQRYLGTWYEIARFDFFFENNIDEVTANYSLNADGSIKVINRGYSTKKLKYQESVGKAKFKAQSSVGALKVSFFGPFYGGYNIIALDPEYQYALVAGDSYKYLWILSRTPSIPDTIRDEYLAKAKSLGFTTENLVWTKHTASK